MNRRKWRWISAGRGFVWAEGLGEEALEKLALIEGLPCCISYILDLELVQLLLLVISESNVHIALKDNMHA